MSAIVVHFLGHLLRFSCAKNTLFYHCNRSIHRAENATTNRENAGIRRAADLISFENLTPAERALTKNKEAGKITIAKIKNAHSIKIAKRLLAIQLPVQIVADSTELSLAVISTLKQEIEGK